MHCLKEVFEKIISEESLYQGYRLALRGNSKSKTAMEFYFDAERQISQLHEGLKSGVYSPGDLYSFKIYDPKERNISAAPFRDRVLHQAICAELEPFLEKNLFTILTLAVKTRGHTEPFSKHKCL